MKKLITVIFLLCSLFSVQLVASSGSKNTIKQLTESIISPNFELNDLEDSSRTLDEFDGKVIAVNFWATWCPPCREELPSMQATYEEFKDDGFIILGINVGEDWGVVASFLDALEIDFPILLDLESNTMNEWGGYGLPTTFIVDRSGSITHRIDGGRNWGDPLFRNQLIEIIKKK